MSTALFRVGSLLWRWSFRVCFVFATVIALLPQPPRLPLGGFGDKIEHMVGFAVLSALALLAFPAADRLRMALGLSAFGAAIEVLQAIPALHRTSDPLDWLADTAVVVLVIGSAALFGRPKVRR